MILFRHALAEPGERERIIKEAKRLFVRARTNNRCQEKIIIINYE